MAAAADASSSRIHDSSLSAIEPLGDESTVIHDRSLSSPAVAPRRGDDAALGDAVAA